MNYKVEYSHIRNGRRVTEYDTTFQLTTQDAADKIREWYGDLDGFRIERIYKDAGNCWEISEAWD